MKKLLLVGIIILSGCAQKGADGAAGASAKISRIISCNMVVSGQAGAAAALNNLVVAYQESIMGSGDVYVTATVSNSTYTVANSNFYASSQNGAINGSITVGYDANTASNAYFVFSTTSGVTSFNYQDTNPATNVTVTVTPCTTTNF